MTLSKKIKEEAKALGIKNYANYKKETLKAKIDEIKGSKKPKAKAKASPKTKERTPKAIWDGNMKAILDKATEGQACVSKAKKELYVDNAQWKSAMLDRASSAFREAHNYILKIK